MRQVCGRPAAAAEDALTAHNAQQEEEFSRPETVAQFTAPLPAEIQQVWALLCGASCCKQQGSEGQHLLLSNGMPGVQAQSGPEALAQTHSHDALAPLSLQQVPQQAIVGVRPSPFRHLHPCISKLVSHPLL